VWCLGVSHEADDDHGGGLHDGHCLHDFLLVELGARAVELANDVSHASLVSHEGGEVGGVLGVVRGERAQLAAHQFGALAGGKAEVAVAGSFEFTVTHVCVWKGLWF